MDRTLPMKLAIEKAWQYQGLTFPNPAVGCSVVDEHGKILSTAAHEKAGGSHAEVLALQQAFDLLHEHSTILNLTDSFSIHNFLLENHNHCFEKCTLYVTLEPCAHVGRTPSCAGLIQTLGIEKVVIAQMDPNAVAAGGAEALRQSGVNVQIGMCENGAYELLKPFIIWQSKPYVTFKWAQRLDGTIDGGTISSLESRTFVHKMRSVSDLLVIGGNTVRKDRPTLDARLVDGKAPDILILSHSAEFDETIPLFSVKDRKILIDSSLAQVANYSNILIEGGPGMFASVKEYVDSYLCFVAPSSGGTIQFTSTEENFKMIYTLSSGNDQQLWMR